MRTQLSSEPALQLIDMSARYRKDDFVFSAFNLSVKRGGRILLAGADNAGKTTLLRIFSGYLRPVSGRVLIHGTHFSPESKSKIAYIPEVFALKEKMTPREISEIYEMFFSDYDRDNLFSFLEKNEIDPDKAFDILSPDKQQIAQFGFSMARDAKIYLLDNSLNLLADKEKSMLLRSFFDKLSDDATVIYTGLPSTDLEEYFTDLIYLKDNKIEVYENLSYLKNRYGRELWEILESLFNGGLY